MSFLRWRYYDLIDDEYWTVPLNPREMTSPFGPKNVRATPTTARDGLNIVFEGQAEPHQWQFSGAILSQPHYQGLLEWYQKRRRIIIRDHFGRDIHCYLTHFDPEPKRAVRVMTTVANADAYWRHEYTMSALVFEVGPATQGVLA